MCFSCQVDIFLRDTRGRLAPQILVGFFFKKKRRFKTVGLTFLLMKKKGNKQELKKANALVQTKKKNVLRIRKKTFYS
jgi:hypothetical protein